MLTIDIDPSDIERAWAAAVREMSRGVVLGVQRGVMEGADAALATGRWKDRSGETRRKTRGIVDVVVQNGAVGRLESLVPWASFLDAGTSPHEIRPKEGHGFVGPLRGGQSRRTVTDIGTHRASLRWESAGGIRFARVVHHPGTKATGYMAEGMRKCERVIVREVEIGVARAQSLLQ